MFAKEFIGGIKQERIHGTPVVDGWAGAVLKKLLTLTDTQIKLT